MRGGLHGFSTEEPINCEAMPQYCGEPLHCEKAVTEEEKEAWKTHLAVGGQPNLRSWCNVKGFSEGVVNECLVKKDLSAAGKMTYKEQAKNNALEADGSYCFLVGHCDNDLVTNETTLEEAAQMCDDKFGHAGWTEFGMNNMHVIQWLISGQVSTTTGFHTREAANSFAKLACAMGNYHCDVVYCRENYCNNKYFKDKYGTYSIEDPPPPIPLKG